MLREKQFGGVLEVKMKITVLFKAKQGEMNWICGEKNKAVALKTNIQESAENKKTSKMPFVSVMLTAVCNFAAFERQPPTSHFSSKIIFVLGCL